MAPSYEHTRRWEAHSRRGGKGIGPLTPRNLTLGPGWNGFDQGVSYSTVTSLAPTHHWALGQGLNQRKSY